jgi:hypothetical protein
MSDDLDSLLARLGAAGADRSLEDLEASVVGSIAQRRAEAATARSLAPVRALAVGFSVALGIAAGGMAAATTAAAPQQFSTFSSEPHLAPSTLLEGAG